LLAKKLLQRLCPPSIKPIERDRLVVQIGTGDRAVEVRLKIDILSLEGSRIQNAGQV